MENDDTDSMIKGRTPYGPYGAAVRAAVSDELATPGSAQSAQDAREAAATKTARRYGGSKKVGQGWGD